MPVRYNIFCVKRGYYSLVAKLEGPDPSDDEMDPRDRFIGDFRTKYEAFFEKRQLEAGNITMEEVKGRLYMKERAERADRRPKRDRYKRLRLGLEVI